MCSKLLNILFCPMPTYGYMNPLIGIAQRLYRRGHRIIFLAEENWKQKLINCGFEVIVMINDEEILTIETLHKSGCYDAISPLEKMKLYVTELMPIAFIKSKVCSNKIKEILHNVEVNIIITNYEVLPSIIKSQCPWIFASPANPLYHLYDERTPPMFSGLPLYDSSEWSDFHNEVYRVTQPMKNLYNKLLIEEGLSPFKENRLFFCESPFLNIYNMPKELDYTHIRPLPKKWMQFDCFMRTENEIFEFPDKLAHKTGKLIYFTMGSILSINVQMMKRLINIMKETPHRYIVSKGTSADSYDLPDNMWGDQMVPQTKVLPLVDMVIFHGGHNTLVEAFYYGIPMIIMPLGNDAFDNAQRVIEEGFGIKLDPLNCTKEELINSIDDILNNNKLAKRLKKVSQRIQNEDNTDKLVYEIESVICK